MITGNLEKLTLFTLTQFTSVIISTRGWKFFATLNENVLILVSFIVFEKQHRYYLILLPFCKYIVYIFYLAYEIKKLTDFINYNLL